MKNSANTATQILRGMVLSLLENGFKTQEIAASLDKLRDEAGRDDWQKGLETRARARDSSVVL